MGQQGERGNVGSGRVDSVTLQWPALPLQDWKQTRDTLHLYTQVAGKIRLALSPEEPEWQHVVLYATARGLTTGPMPFRGLAVEIAFDFLDHGVTISMSNGPAREIALVPRSVAAFYADVMKALKELGVDVRLNPMPQEVPHPIPLNEDTTHAAYDRGAIARFWQILSDVDMVFREHRAPFRGRQTLVQFFWGSFDLSYSRFSGRPADSPSKANLIMRKGMDAEEVCTGFWFGDDRLPEPAFYCYAYPKPDGLENATIRPAAAFWSKEIGEFLLRYEDVRTSPSPRAAILDFLQSTYQAAKQLQAPS